jgi:hypothetical protein
MARTTVFSMSSTTTRVMKMKNLEQKPGFLKSEAWTAEQINGLPIVLTYSDHLQSQLKLQVRGRLSAICHEDGMIVLVQAADKSGRVGSQPIVTQDMLDNASEENGVLLMGLK